MTLNQLLTFAAIAKDLNLSHASAKLRVSQSSISQQMRKLENQFKTKLYRKSQRGIVLTEEGETFLRYVQVILSGVQNLFEGFEKVASTKTPTTLRVGGSFAPSASFLPRVLATFQKRNPSTRLELKTHDSVTLERMLLNSELDVALLNHRPKSVDLIAEPYRLEKLVAFSRANNALANKKRVTLRELAMEPLIIRGAKTSQTLIERLLSQVDSGIRPNIVLRCESPAAVKTAVGNNMGIGVLFRNSVKQEIQSRKFKGLKLLDAALDVKSYIVFRRETLAPAVSNFIDILRKSRTVF